MYQEGWLLRIGLQLRAVAFLLPVRYVACYSPLSFARSLVASRSCVVFPVHYSRALLFYY